MLKSNLNKIRKNQKEIDRLSKEHHRRRLLAEKHYERVSKSIKENRQSDLKKRIRKKLSSH